MSKQIIIVKPKTLSPKDKEKLTKDGNVVIEHPNAAEVVFRQVVEQLPYVVTNCATCGERIYMLSERVAVLRTNKKNFYCSQGHCQSFT
jgi:hypothetical protein